MVLLLRCLCHRFPKYQSFKKSRNAGLLLPSKTEPAHAAVCDRVREALGVHGKAAAQRHDLVAHLLRDLVACAVFQPAEHIA